LKPVIGFFSELAALAVVWLVGPLVPSGPAYLLYLLVAELLSTYLVHCPAHYIVGRVLGIRFVDMKLGRTTLAKALPPRFSRFARLMPILTLKADRSSLSGAGTTRASAMYASGTFASVLSALIAAAWATPWAPVATVAFMWGIAVIYLIFDLVFSPRSGDIMRMRKVRRSSASEPPRVEK
jgi:hypothetical protein